MKFSPDLSVSPVGARLADSLRNGSATQRRIADTILRFPIRTASASIDDMAKMTGASAATISRFARDIGFGGYAQMRSAIADAAQALADPVTKLRQRLAAGKEGPDRASSGDAAIFDASRDQLQLMDSALVNAGVQRIVARLKAARAVHVMGFGLSAHIASILVLGLQPFHPNVASVVEYGGTEVAAGRLMGVGPQDVVIAITVPRYSTDVVRLARFARAQGATIIAITDSEASPLAPVAQELMLAPAAHPVLSSSMVAALAVSEAIVAAMMLSDKDNADRAETLTKAIASYLHQDREL
ncbi:MAG: MurR/RpiR family transcriptional regulator [Beijerinckiaceae bacterium]